MFSTDSSSTRYAANPGWSQFRLQDIPDYMLVGRRRRPDPRLGHAGNLGSNNASQTQSLNIVSLTTNYATIDIGDSLGQRNMTGLGLDLQTFIFSIGMRQDRGKP